MNDATKSYNKTKQEISVKIKALVDLIEANSKMQSQDSKNWGYVGSLNLVRNDLDEIINFLSYDELLIVKSNGKLLSKTLKERNP